MGKMRLKIYGVKMPPEKKKSQWPYILAIAVSLGFGVATLIGSGDAVRIFTFLFK